jgi:hypothetical protein
MLATLSLTFTAKADASEVLTPQEQTQVATLLEDDAQLMSDAQLTEQTADLPPATQAEILRINEEARPFALQVALLIPILAAAIGLIQSFRMVKLPDPEPSEAAEMVLGG